MVWCSLLFSASFLFFQQGVQFLLSSLPLLVFEAKDGIAGGIALSDGELQLLGEAVETEDGRRIVLFATVPVSLRGQR
jgi:hypothetical protein